MPRLGQTVAIMDEDGGTRIAAIRDVGPGVWSGYRSVWRVAETVSSSTNEPKSHTWLSS